MVENPQENKSMVKTMERNTNKIRKKTKAVDKQCPNTSFSVRMCGCMNTNRKAMKHLCEQLKTCAMENQFEHL